jgi:nitric-oxide synthase
MMVKLKHPEFDWFENLNLQWYAIPVISNMMLEIGGVFYTAAPFNGWYMSTEIGSRNLADQNRYNLLPIIAEKMGIDTKSQHSLWKDKAMLELNRAVIYSFQIAGVMLTTHHEAAEQFLQFEQNEAKHGRNITADWAWITPPMSSAATPVFHKEYDNSIKGPNFFYQDSPLEKIHQTKPSNCPFHASQFD